jgi:predicted dehydrogenase
MLEAVGTEGVLRVPNAFSDPDGIVVLNGSDHHAIPGGDYRDQLADFCAAIRGDHPPLIDRADTLGQAQALDALLRAANIGA